MFSKNYFCIFRRALYTNIMQQEAVHVIFEDSYEIRNEKKKVKSIFL